LVFSPQNKDLDENEKEKERSSLLKVANKTKKREMEKIEKISLGAAF
jgi:hypothetical protein